MIQLPRARQLAWILALELLDAGCTGRAKPQLPTKLHCAHSPAKLAKANTISSDATVEFANYDGLSDLTFVQDDSSLALLIEKNGQSLRTLAARR